jgi:hypothetical protein
MVFFETMSKRRKGFPSEKKVKRGVRIVHGNKELSEKLGRNDLCPCGSGRRFKKCCLKKGCFRRRESGPLLLGSDEPDLLGLRGRAVSFIPAWPMPESQHGISFFGTMHCCE